MVISVLVLVGQFSEWIDDIIEVLGQVYFGVWNDLEVVYGLFISFQVKQCVVKLIVQGKEEGVICLFDGS